MAQVHKKKIQSPESMKGHALGPIKRREKNEKAQPVKIRKSKEV